MRILFATALFLTSSAGFVQAQPRTTLDIYVVDVEGGNATLFVTPSGESVLIDTGNANGAVRDAGRIMEAVRDARLTQIDHLIITHWHGDHFGGLAELAKQIPIKAFIEHGPTAQPTPATDEFMAKTYTPLLAGATRTVVKPGDRVALTGVDWRIVSSNGQTLPAPLSGAGAANPSCATFEPIANNEEDPMSVASYITFGQFRTAHLGDATRNIEFRLMCPRTSLPPVQVLLGLHHGQSSSNSPVLTHALRLRVGIMNNGTRKGGEPYSMKSIFTAPGFEDLWQIHFSQLSGQEYTAPGLFIANLLDEPSSAMPIAPIEAPQPGPNTPPAPVHNGKAYWIKVSAQRDGTFTVTNARNGFSKTYAAK